MTEPETISWSETRAKRPPNEDAVAKHRARFGAEARLPTPRDPGRGKPSPRKS